MGLDDGAADGESHAGALGLGREERLENLVRVRREPDAAVGDQNQQVLVLIAARGHHDSARVIHVLHRLDAVHYQVEEHLLQ